MNKAVTVKESKLSGRGLFVTKAIAPGEKVLYIQGEIVGLAKFFRVPQKVRDNMYRFSQNEYLSPAGEYGDFVNHSCLPNSKIVKKGRRLYVVAIKNIPKGAEVHIDYSTILAKDDYWIMRCVCNNKTCRKKIKRYTTLPKHILDLYISTKLIPSYILNIH